MQCLFLGVLLLSLYYSSKSWFCQSPCLFLKLKDCLLPIFSGYFLTPAPVFFFVVFADRFLYHLCIRLTGEWIFRQSAEIFHYLFPKGAPVSSACCLLPWKLLCALLHSGPQCRCSCILSSPHSRGSDLRSQPGSPSRIIRRDNHLIGKHTGDHTKLPPAVERLASRTAKHGNNLRYEAYS